MEKINIIISDFFSLSELLHSETAERYNIEEQYILIVPVLANLENLCRNVLDKCKRKFADLKIISAYRCEVVNNIEKKSPDSLHQIGKAADITCSNLPALWELIRKMDIDRAIRYDNYIHVSYDQFFNRHLYTTYTTS